MVKGRGLYFKYNPFFILITLKFTFSLIRPFHKRRCVFDVTAHTVEVNLM